MKKLLYSSSVPGHPLLDRKKWITLCFVLMLTGLTINHSVWARPGHSSSGSVIGGGGGGGGGSRGGGGHMHSGGSHRHFNHGHRHHNHIGIGFGGFYSPGFFGPGFFGSGYYGGYPYSYRYRYPSAYYYPNNYYSSPFIAPSGPTVYIQREAPAAAPAQQTTNYWYYCRNPEGYYPYVKQCPEGWLQVAPQPTPQ